MILFHTGEKQFLCFQQNNTYIKMELGKILEMHSLKTNSIFSPMFLTEKMISN